MEILEFVLLLASCVLSIIMLIYQIVQTVNMKKLQIKSNMLLYVKQQDFALMKNAGDDPCKIKSQFILPTFSQDCDYLVK